MKTFRMLQISNIATFLCWFEDFHCCSCAMFSNFTNVFASIFWLHVVNNEGTFPLFCCSFIFDIIWCKFNIILVPRCWCCFIWCLTDNFNSVRWCNLNRFDFFRDFKDDFCTNTIKGYCLDVTIYTSKEGSHEQRIQSGNKQVEMDSLIS